MMMMQIELYRYHGEYNKQMDAWASEWIEHKNSILMCFCTFDTTKSLVVRPSAEGRSSSPMLFFDIAFWRAY